MLKLKAWLVLDDCRYARKLLDGSFHSEEWRYRWSASVVLLRVVGHVLAKVDKEASSRHNEVIDDEYNKLQQTFPDPKIYWEFIVKERNIIVKEYAFNDQIMSGSSVTAMSYTDPDTGKTETFESRQNRAGRMDVYSKTIISGSFEGQKKIDVVDDAIKWWESYLNNIEHLVSNP